MTHTHSTAHGPEALAAATTVTADAAGPPAGWLGAVRWIWRETRRVQTLVIPADAGDLIRARRLTYPWHGRNHVLFVDQPVAPLAAVDAIGVVFSSSEVASACLAMGDLETPWTVIEPGTLDAPARWRRFKATARAHRSARRNPSALKRTLDGVASAVGLCVLSPLLLALAGAVAIGMGRPIFFRQPRPGRGGEEFHLLKFRTMRVPRPGEEDPTYDGDRITRLGAFLRRTSLDELPTLINVLMGDMSLVGPRPLLTRYLSRYTDDQARRHHVRPGITGWAQIHGRNAISWTEKFELDVWYVDNRTFWLDLKILLGTVKKVFIREGISSDAHATMPEFMGTEATTAEADRELP